MNEPQVFIWSEEALTKIVNQIKDKQWSLPVPAQISTKGETLRQIINYHAYDDAWVPDVLAGKTAAEVGKKYDGDLLGKEPQKSWHAIVDKAVAAVSPLTDDELEKKVHLSYGDYPIHEYLTHITFFRTFRAVDIARFIGVDYHLDLELVKGVWQKLVPSAEALRQMGVIGPEVKVGEDADLHDRMLALTGRQP